MASPAVPSAPVATQERAVFSSPLSYVVVFVATSPLLFVRLSEPRMWTDEWLTFHFSSSWSAVTRDGDRPFLSYALIHAWRALFGNSGALATSRVFSVLCWLAACLLWAPLFRRVGAQLGRPGVALGVWTLLLAGPFAAHYARVVRYYAPSALLVAVATVAFDHYVDGKERRWMLLASAAAVALGLGDFIAFVMLGVVEGVWLVGHRRNDYARHLARWASMAVLVIVGLLAVGQRLSSVLAPLSEWLSPSKFAKAVLEGGGHSIYALYLGENLSPLRWYIVLPAAVAWGAALVLSARRGWRHESELTSTGETGRQGIDLPHLAPAAGVLLLGATVAAVQVGVKVHLVYQTPKLLVPFAAIFLLAAAPGFSSMIDRRRGVAILAGAAVAGAAVWGLVNYLSGREFLYRSYDLPWDTAAAVVTQQAGPDGVVIYGDGPLDYYLARLGSRLPVHSVALDFDPQADVHDIRSRRHAAIVVVTRDTIENVLAARLSQLRQVALESGYRIAQSYPVGHADHSLTRLESRLTGRQLSDVLLTVIVLRRA